MGEWDDLIHNVEEPLAKPRPLRLLGYPVGRILGYGAGSVIYSTLEVPGNETYALKHVVVRNDKDRRLVEQILNEYAVGTKITHPLLRRYISVKVKKGLLGRVKEATLVMEMVRGETCEKNPPTDLQKIVRIFQQVATALRAMHLMGYLHCDMKPNNIIVDEGGGVKVIDLGQACPIGSVKERIQGTPDFIAPEQVRREPLSVQTDIYNLGATIYWMVSNHRRLPTLFTIKRSANSFLLSQSIPTPLELNPQVPANLSNLVMECVRTVAGRRPADMGEICHRLEVIHYTLRNRLNDVPQPADPSEETHFQ